MSTVGRIPTLRECQQRLLVWGQVLPKFGADGRGGAETQLAILKFQRAHWPPLKATGEFDGPTVEALFRRPPGAVTTIGEEVAIGAISVIVNSILKKVGVQVDFSKISKAIAGAISGAGMAGGAAAYTYISLPESAQSVLPHWVGVVVPIVNMCIGGIVGFSVVYFAPPNKG